MLLSGLADYAEVILAALPVGVQEHALLIGTLAAVLSAWLLWRLWRFTILPMLYPDDPKELPYWIPSEYKCRKYTITSSSEQPATNSLQS